MNTLKIIPTGTPARLLVPGGEAIPCIVNGASIRGTTISYEIIRFAGQDRKVEWVNEQEITTDAPERQKIGFTTRDDPQSRVLGMYPCGGSP